MGYPACLSLSIASDLDHFVLNLVAIYGKGVYDVALGFANVSLYNFLLERPTDYELPLSILRQGPN